MEVHIPGAWLTCVQSDEPIYVACKNCRTKIGLDGKCKKADDADKPCVTTPSGEKTAFTSVRVADASASMDDILVRDEIFCTLAGVKNIDELAAVVAQSGVQGLCFQTRCDIRVGANSAKKPKPGAAVGEPECSFQILWAKPTTFAAWDTAERPPVAKLLAVTGDPHGGHVLPIADIATDLEESPMGVKFRHADVTPGYVSILCVTDREPDSAEAVVNENKYVQLTHRDVQALTKSGERSWCTFVVESICPLKRIAHFSIADGQPRLVVGSVTFTKEGPVLAAAQTFRLHDGDANIKAFHAEREGWWGLLQGATVACAKRRKAVELITETPSKKKWPSITV